MARSQRRKVVLFGGIPTAIVVVAGVSLWCARRPSERAAPWIALARHSAVEPARLSELVRESRVVLVGEFHGFAEPPATVKEILTDPGADRPFTHLAVEWFVSDQPDIDRYLAGDDAALERFRREKGNGVTAEYFSVWSFVRDYNRTHPHNPIALRAIDLRRPKLSHVQDGVAPERDRHMFEQIEQLLASNDKSRVLVYCGAMHAAKCGLGACATRDGSTVQVPTLGALLQERYHSQVASIRVLCPRDPMWHELARSHRFARPVAFRLSPQWPELGTLVLSNEDYPDPASARQSIARAYDYAVWWPTSREGTRAE